MTKEELTLEVIRRLKVATLWRNVLWIMIRHGSYWSVSGLLPSVQMPE